MTVIPNQCIKKRTKYSKNGCQECKRMKVKCDELTPKCSRCSKGYKSCIYPLPKSKQSTRSTPNKATTNKSPSTEAHLSNSTPSPSRKSSPLSLDSFDRLEEKFTNHDFIEMINEDISSRFDRAIDSSLSNVPLHHENQRNSGLLDQIDQNTINDLKPLSGEYDPSQDFLTTDTLYQIPLEFFDFLNEDKCRFYLEVFYKEFSHVILPMEPQLHTNPIRDILLQYSFRKNYLFHAILATGARFSFNKRGLEEDQKYYSQFMKITLEMLDDLIFVKDFVPNPNESTQKMEITKTVETLLLTILILTSDNASSVKQSWRGHLKGAKDLLHKVFMLKRFNDKSRVLIFCKLWFTSFEVLACLTAPRGGTIRDDSEWKCLIFDATNEQELVVLQELKLITDEGFNLLFGYHNSILSSVIRLIHVTKSGQTSMNDIDLSDSIFQLISDFKANQHLSMMKNVPSSAISMYRNSSTGDVRSISWYDICHESHVDASLLTMMTSLFSVSKGNVIVQGLVQKILSRLQVLNGDYDCLNDSYTSENGVQHPNIFNLMLLQWPLLVAGLNSVTPKDRDEVANIFRLLEALGSGSSKFALDKIKKNWNNELNPNEVDIVTY